MLWNENAGVIGIDWKDGTSSMTDEDFKEELTTFAGFVEQKKARGILVDVLHFRHKMIHSDRIEQIGGRRPCRAFRPHAGWRSGQMYAGLRQIDYKFVGWGWMLWDWNWFRRRTADGVVSRISARVADGDIVVMHDGDESAPFQDQRHTVEATARLIPILRDRGFAFGTVCQNGL